MGKQIYFASDFHFGIPDAMQSLEREKMFIRWLGMVRQDAAEIFLMGDLFDFWFEYKTVIPRGHSRLFGKLAEITDAGIPVHLFRGNHDMWAFDYLQSELDIRLYRDPEFMTLLGKKFYLAHGDGLGPGDHGYKFIKKVFACRFNQWLFRWFHPDWGIRMALFWSRKSRYAAIEKEKKSADRNRKLIEQRLTIHAQEMVENHPDLDYLVCGHYHYPLIEKMNNGAQLVVVGDWLTHFTYAVFDGEKMELRTMLNQEGN